MKTRLLLTFILSASFSLLLTCTSYGQEMKVLDANERSDSPTQSVLQTADAKHFELAGQFGGRPGPVMVLGSYAYIGEGPKLTILDISNPANPTPVGRSAPAVVVSWNGRGLPVRDHCLAFLCICRFMQVPGDKVDVELDVRIMHFGIALVDDDVTGQQRALQ